MSRQTEKNAERGNAIFITLLAIALFAALGYAFTSGSRTGTMMITDVVSEAENSNVIQYNNTIATAVKRLKLRGCADSEISYETPNGNNINPNAPTDETCHVFRLKGGQVQFQGIDVATTLEPGNITKISTREDLSVKCDAWGGNECTKPMINVNGNGWHQSTMPFDRFYFCFVATNGADTVPGDSSADLCAPIGHQYYQTGTPSVGKVPSDNPTAPGSDIALRTTSVLCEHDLRTIECNWTP
jgi:hypothetical protein